VQQPNSKSHAQQGLCKPLAGDEDDIDALLAKFALEEKQLKAVQVGAGAAVGTICVTWLCLMGTKKG
jgi:hypothetical protein